MTPPGPFTERVANGVRRVFRLAVRRAAWTEADVDEELRFHIAMRTDDLVARGWSAVDAEAEARARFGPSWDAAVKGLHQSGRTREEQLAMRERIQGLLYDVRYSLRALRHAPRYTAAAVLTLALGLGASTVVFSLVDHIVLRPLPYRAPEQLVVVREVFSELQSVYPTMPANASHFLEWRRACSACTGLAAVVRSTATLSGTGDPQQLGAVRVSANLFPLLGVSPALGRGFRDEEDSPGRNDVVVLSDATWKRHFGEDPSVIGRTITLNNRSVEVIGVLPPLVDLPGRDALGALASLPGEVELYQPLALTQEEARRGGSFDYVVLARLAPGATLDQARAQLDAVGQTFAAREGGGITFSTVLVPVQSQIVGEASRPLLLLLAAVAALLLIVCVNLVNLSLARGAGKQREFAVRVALGASAGRLARLAIVESLVLACAGGALGVMLSHWGLRALVALAPVTLPRVAEVRLDARVFGVAVLLTLVVGLLVAVLPALGAGRTHPGEALKAGGRTMTGSRAAGRRRSLFITLQVAFSTLLLVGTGLFLSSFVRVLNVDPGVDTEHVVALNVALPRTTYPSGDNRWAFYERAITAVAAVPGIANAAVASALPLEGETWIDGVARAEDAESSRERPLANFRFVSADYFTTVGTKLRSGRAFDATDRAREAIIISEHTATTLWPGTSALGKRMVAGRFSGEVIGVAANVNTTSLEQTGNLVVYLPAWMSAPSQGVVIARTTSPAGAAAISAVRAALRRVDPTVAVPKSRTLAQVVSATVAARRFQLALLGLFAVLALVTASIGIYGVIAQSLASRRNEIGVRMALGAQRARIHWLVLREGLVPVAIGMMLGMGASLATSRVMTSMLYGVTPSDPGTLAGVGVLLGVVAAVACGIPAWRATRADVPELLRAE
ncbi:MAG TPA: ABC transporter permease [Gemmatimonas sp.]|nr:ABC transporter permease [Gemmatimonas sp.]